MDTIFAQATAPGRAGISVIRVSGPAAFDVAIRLSGPLPAPNTVALRAIRDLEGGVLDRGLVLPFIAPHSFTGEDVVEFHVHGSTAVVSAVLRLLGSQPRVRLAEAGEFTRRALENDRLDLTQVEGLADLIDAETEAQRQQAMRVFSGHIGEVIEGWRADLVRAAALIEATIDFADEDVPEDVTPEVLALLARVETQISREVEGVAAAERLRNGFEVAIVGAPNTGKSTLLNALAGRDAAITSEVAGTTRDIVEVKMDLKGLPVTILDTAGLRETNDTVEKIGVARAMERAKGADLRIFLQVPGGSLPLQPMSGDIILCPKADLHPDISQSVSGLTGEGIPELVDELGHVLSERCAAIGVATHERHRNAMSGALDALAAVKEVVRDGPDRFDIAAEELRAAIFRLEAVVGRIDVENLLDEIFSSFCIGK